VGSPLSFSVFGGGAPNVAVVKRRARTISDDSELLCTAFALEPWSWLVS
jgi:hypothetical protein